MILRILSNGFTRSFIALLLVASFAISVPVNSAKADAGAQPAAKYLVLISIDSCRPDYLALAPTPNIDMLKAAGTSYSDSWVGQVSNDTPPGQTSMSTGSFGKNTRIISFNWRDSRVLPADWEFKLAITQKILELIKLTGWDELGLWYQQNMVRKTIEGNFITNFDNVASGFFNSYIRESGVISIGSLYKKANPGAKVAAISCDKWYACAGLAADGADYTVFAEARGVAPIGYNNVEHLKPTGVAGMMPPDYIMKDPSLLREVEDERDTDTWATDVALQMIEKTAPQVLLINLPAIDDAGHATGGITDPQKMAAVMANVDAQVGRIMDAYKKAGKYDDTVWVITSDHAMTPFGINIEQTVIDKLLVEARNFANVGAHVYLMDQSQTQQVAEKLTKANIPGIFGAYYRVKSPGGNYSYVPTTDTAPKVEGDLDKCYRYLLDTYAGESSPDIELLPVENCHINWTMFDCKPFIGQHDSISWLQQNNILIISGPGARKGFVSDSPARLVDIAPTALTLLGIRPERMDGIVLSDALESPTTTQLHTQITVNSELMPLVQALKARSEADLKAQK
jgi:predicted AlkP superfamily pyrophosphatase or phosphodiesterase